MKAFLLKYIRLILSNKLWFPRSYLNGNFCKSSGWLLLSIPLFTWKISSIFYAQNKHIIYYIFRILIPKSVLVFQAFAPTSFDDSNFITFFDNIFSKAKVTTVFSNMKNWVNLNPTYALQVYVLQLTLYNLSIIITKYTIFLLKSRIIYYLLDLHGRLKFTSVRVPA